MYKFWLKIYKENKIKSVVNGYTRFWVKVHSKYF